MKQIYNFEASAPPRVTAKYLREETERRRLRRQITLIRLASVLSSTVLALFAFAVARFSNALALLSIAVLCVSLIGNGVISVIFSRKPDLILNLYQ